MGERAARAGETAWWRRCLRGFWKGVLLQGLYQDALETAYIDEVYGQSSLTGSLQTECGVAFSQPQQLLALPELGPGEWPFQEPMGKGRHRGPSSAAWRLMPSGARRV